MIGGTGYRIIGAYDSETSNIKVDGFKKAFPILHQLGIIRHFVPVDTIDSDTVEDAVKVTTYRHTFEICAIFDAMSAHDFGFVPVICCHNLGFDMQPLSVWLSSRNVRVLAKSSRKPITFTVLDDESKPRLVLWDTAVFSQKPLSMMGHECGYEKGIGEWDYSLTRTPYTELTDEEMDYARRDIFSLIAWLGYWCRMNPDIPPDSLGLNVVTKTGVIRAKRRIRHDHIKGLGCKYNIGRFWHYLNKRELPKSDEELFTMHAATRGGFTFCASAWASKPVTPESGMQVIGYDATSQHPAQMVAHRYPVGFRETTSDNLSRAFRIIASYSVEEVLCGFKKPFPVAFYGLFEFENLRPKAGSIYKREGVLPLASARLSRQRDINPDNEDAEIFKERLYRRGYRDSATNPVVNFGKVVSADRARLYMTELTAWEISRCYDYDSVNAISGYITMRFERPSDMAVISVMQFYQAKNEFKKARESYYKHSTIDNGDRLRALGFAPSIVADMEGGTINADDVDFLYLGTKADLNGLFGIEATNEFRKECIIGESGIEYQGTEGLHNAPKNPKAWYQFGQRIVGWSRIAQLLVIELCKDHVAGIVNGDTDSLKFAVELGREADIEGALARYAAAIDAAKDDNCARVRRSYPALYDALDGIGHYVEEFRAGHFCASWNKAYCMLDRNDRFKFILAGITTSRLNEPIDFNRLADARLKNGEPFASIAGDLLGYNLVVAPDVTGQNQRIAPEWGEYFTGEVIDYKGDAYHVAEPAAIALFPLAKSINDTMVPENRSNMAIALKNNPAVVADSRILTADGIVYTEWIG